MTVRYKLNVYLFLGFKELFSNLIDVSEQVLMVRF